MIKRCVDKIIRKYKKIDVMVYCSGAYVKKKAELVTDKDWDKVLDTNLKGGFFANQIVGKIMLKKGRGSIINIGSLGSSVGSTDAVRCQFPRELGADHNDTRLGGAVDRRHPCSCPRTVTRAP